MAALRLRCRTSTGRQITIDQLTADSQLSSLLDCIYEAAEIGRDHELCLKCGYPPRALDLSQPACSLASLGLASGESLIVEAKRSADWQRRKATELDAVLCGQAAAAGAGAGGGGGGGFLSVCSIPANNSCLFLAIDYCVRGRSEAALEAAGPMRGAIAESVAADPDTYTEAFLERPNAAYCQWILSPSSWGGAIELSILCRRLGVQINVVDTQTSRIDCYPAEGAADKVYLIYDGIHYDALAMEDPAEEGRLTTRFPVGNEAVERMAEELGREARSAGLFTDVSKFQLQCADCKVYLRGETEARRHAKTTGHASFTETRGAAS